MAAIEEEPEPDRSALVRLASLVLLWERLWPALAPAVGVVGLFLVLALFDVPERLPGTVHLGLLILFALALLAALGWGLRGFRLPGPFLARRRVERDSGLVHRPLEALEDRIASGGDDADSLALWQAHRQRMAEAARRLRLDWPKAGLVRRDPLALRAVLALLLILGAIDAGPDWAERISRSLVPHLAPVAAAASASLDIWVTPPDYTGLPPRLLPKAADGAPVPVPAGSVLLAQVHGRGDVPRLALAGQERRFTRIDAADFTIKTPLAKSGTLSVSQGGTRLGRWRIAIVPDRPPTVAFVGTPRPTRRGALRIEYRARDDYGVEGVRAVMHLVANPKAPPLRLDLALPGLHLKDAHGTSYRDLTPNPWAGLAVTMVLRAKDARGQTGTSDPVTVTLPERIFHNPVARAIIAQRKDLALHPDARQRVAQALSDLSLRPGRFGGDIVVFLALRTAHARLLLNHDADTIPAVQQLLWQTALRIEDGRAPLMQRDLRDAMKALQNALARHAPQAEIDRLMAQLRAAMDRYMQALMQNAQRQGGQNLPPVDSSAMRMTSRDLEAMLDRAQQLARMGARDAARDLLAQLQDMLENLRVGRASAMSGPAQQTMDQMRDMMARQQRLLDHSFRDARDGRADELGAAAMQEELRRMLNAMTQRLGSGKDGVPQALGRAERAMGNAAKALRRGDPRGAIAPQTEALDQLQQGARGLGRRLRGGAEQNGLAEGESADQDGRLPRDRDPFGRAIDSGWLGDGGRLRFGAGPDTDTALRRAKTILDELRRRAGERDRPAIERDYIDRLLKEF